MVRVLAGLAQGRPGIVSRSHRAICGGKVSLGQGQRQGFFRVGLLCQCLPVLHSTVFCLITDSVIKRKPEKLQELCSTLKYHVTS